MNLKWMALFAAVVVFGSCGPDGNSGTGGGAGGGFVATGGGSGSTGGGSGSTGGGSGQQCFCTMTINGETQQTAVCGGLLCFEAFGEYYRCDVSGSTSISSCGSTGGGTGSTGGGSGSTGGGTGSTGGGSGSTGGGSGSTGGGSGSTGGGSGSTGGGNGATCTGDFSCGNTTCDSATQYCKVGCDSLNHVNTYTCTTKSSSTCSAPDNYCISYIAISNCMSGRKATCSGDDATRGLTYGCECL